MSIPDPVVAVRAFLLGDADLAALIGTRVFAGILPRSEVEPMPRKAVLIRKAGMGASAGNRSRIGISAPRLDVFAYGETPYEASRVDLAAYDALKQMEPHNEGVCRLFDAVLTGGPIDLEEEDTGWSLVFRSYEIAAAEVAVA